MGAFAIVYGVIRASLLFGVVALLLRPRRSPDANFAAALVVLAVASVSFIGIGMMTAVLPLISPEKGTQLGFVAQGLLLVVSGVYYPVSVLPRVDAVDLDDLAGDLRAARDPRRDPRRRRRRRCGPNIWPLIVIGDRLGPARPRGLPARRALREAARQAEAVGMIERPARRERRGPRGLDPRQARRAPERVRVDRAASSASVRSRTSSCRRRARRGGRRRRARRALGRAGSRLRRAARSSQRYAGAVWARAMLHRLTEHVRRPGIRQGVGVRRRRGISGVRRAFRLRGGRPRGRAGDRAPRGAAGGSDPRRSRGRLDRLPARAPSRGVLARAGRGLRGHGDRR